MEQKQPPKQLQQLIPLNSQYNVRFLYDDEVLLQKLRALAETSQHLDIYPKNFEEYIKRGFELQPPNPHDEQSLNIFIDWLLLPPNYRTQDFRHPKAISRNISTEPENMEQWIKQLLIPPPHKIFCEKLHGFTPKYFEDLIGDLFRSLGGRVQSSGGVADGGIDLWLETLQGKYVIQCKKWKNSKVGEPIVRDIAGVAAKKQVEGALIFTTSVFTDSAINFTKNFHPRIGLIDGEQLFKIMNLIFPKVVSNILRS